MERSNYGAYGRMQDPSPGRALDGRPTVESQRLAKKRSNPTVRNPSQRLPATPPGDRRPGGGGGSAGLSGDGGQMRKGSLRNAVRKFFGRKSKDVEPITPQQPSLPRHAYHASEPPKLDTQVEEPVLAPQEQSIPQRTLSAPMHALPSPAFDRVRTPYAVEFPQSARLKPIKLGDPFNAPGSQLRRRKTLPSMLVNDDDAATVSAAVGRPPVPKREPFDDSPLIPDRSRYPTIRSVKRLSRSAENLNWQASEGSPSRKRSDEIRYWRESYQASVLHNSVLRASGFVSKEPRDVESEEPAREAIQPLPRPSNDSFATPVASPAGYTRSSPPQPGPFSEADFRSASGYGTELSRDLEDRVARLEAGLQSFQQSLARLTAARNRRTVLVGGVPARRSSADARTPSMLADTLSDPLMTAAWTFGADEPERPSTASPASPHTPIRADTRHPPVPVVRSERLAGAFTAPAASHHHHRTASSLTTPSPPAPPPPIPPPDDHPNNGGANFQQPPPYTFRSLYEMLADERSARRQLERQLRDNASQLQNLRLEISELQYQVSVGSHLQSQRSSFQPVLDPSLAAGSSRLAELLRGTESSPPGTAHGAEDRGQRFQSFRVGEGANDEPASQRLRFSNLTTGTAGTGRSMSTNAGNVTSRFSGSDSGASAPSGTVAGGAEEHRHFEEERLDEEEEELGTPYEDYQTPRGDDVEHFPFSATMPTATTTMGSMMRGGGREGESSRLSGRSGEGEMF